MVDVHRQALRYIFVLTKVKVIAYALLGVKVLIEKHKSNHRAILLTLLTMSVHPALRKPCLIFQPHINNICALHQQSLNLQPQTYSFCTFRPRPTMTTLPASYSTMSELPVWHQQCLNFQPYTNNVWTPSLKPTVFVPSVQDQQWPHFQPHTNNVWTSSLTPTMSELPALHQQCLFLQPNTNTVCTPAPYQHSTMSEPPA
jgi:hypothetical protein